MRPQSVEGHDLSFHLPQRGESLPPTCSGVEALKRVSAKRFGWGDCRRAIEWCADA